MRFIGSTAQRGSLVLRKDFTTGTEARRVYSIFKQILSHSTTIPPTTLAETLSEQAAQIDQHQTVINEHELDNPDAISNDNTLAQKNTLEDPEAKASLQP